MIELIVMGVLALLALIVGLTAGLLVTSRLFSVIFCIIASGAAVKYLLIPAKKIKKENQPGKAKLRHSVQKGEEATPPSAEEPLIAADTAEMINKADHLLQQNPVAISPVPAGPINQEQCSRIPGHAFTRDLGSYEVTAAGLILNRGHQLILQSKPNGIFRAKVYNDAVYVTLCDISGKTGADLSRTGIRQVFVLMDENDCVLSDFPQGRLHVTVAKEAVCRFYDNGTQLALEKKGSAYVTRKYQQGKDMIG